MPAPIAPALQAYRAGSLVDLGRLAQYAYSIGQSNFTEPSELAFDELDEVSLTDEIAYLIGKSSLGRVIAIRGSQSLHVNNLEELSRLASRIYDGPLTSLGRMTPGVVNSYFGTAAHKLWLSILPQLHTGSGEVYFVGHGIGGALATLLALRFAVDEPALKINVITFGSPAVGDSTFAAFYNSTIKNHLRFEIDDDLIPHLPLSPLLGKLISWPVSSARRSPVPYTRLGQLHYLASDRVIDDDATLDLDRERRFRLFALLTSKNPRKAVTDHSLEGNYLPRLQSLLAAAQQST